MNKKLWDMIEEIASVKIEDSYMYDRTEADIYLARALLELKKK